MNIAECIGRAEQAFLDSGLHFGHGTDSAGDEAAWLVLHVVGAKLDGSFDDWQQPVDAGQQLRIAELVNARVETRKPLAYLLGRAWFAGLEFEVNEHVLVPRSPMAEMVLEEFSPWLDARTVTRVLDLCTGSGCIGIAIAAYLPWVQVDASDISPAALQLAARNVARHGVADRVRLVQSDLFEALQGEAYELIITNPPYVPQAASAGIPSEYQAEPGLGLYSGDDGLDMCLRIMMQSPQHLNPEGILVCEVGESAGRLAEALPQVPFTWLEFQSGGEGVFLLEREHLLRANPAISVLTEERASVR